MAEATEQFYVLILSETERFSQFTDHATRLDDHDQGSTPGRDREVTFFVVTGAHSIFCPLGTQVFP
jgi:hypothetical protein